MADFRFNTKERLLTKSEMKIIDYIYQHISLIPYLSISQISEELNVSIATLSRFVRNIGYSNYKELKYAILEHENSATPAGKLHTTLSQSNNTTASDLLLRQESYLAKTRENLSESEVNKAVQKIIEAKTIYLFGKGASAGLAKLFAFRLSRFRKRTVLLHSSGSELFEDLIHVGKQDLVILFGFNKMPLEAKVIFDYKKQINYTVLLFTDRLYSELNEQSDINLFVYRGEKKEYHSMTTPTALIDALIILMARELGTTSMEDLSDLYQLKEKYANEIPR